jgi:hypothetical protein
MSAAFGREALLDAFDRIGRAAVQAGKKLQIAVYGGSALMLASNFRFATEDVDVSELARPLPDWLVAVVHAIAQVNGQKTGSTTGLRFILVRLPMMPPIIWSLVPSRGTRRRRDLRFRCPRRSICSRSS